MADLKALDNKLKTDAAFRAKFINDPAKGLSDWGVTLNPTQLAGLQTQINAAKATGGINNNAGVSVGITVGN